MYVNSAYAGHNRERDMNTVISGHLAPVRKRLLRIAPALALGALLLSPLTISPLTPTSAHADAGSYDAVAQFSLASNPGRAWSYLANGSLLTSQTLDCGATSTVACWWNGQQFPTNARVSANQSSQTQSASTVVLPPGYVYL